MIFQWRNKIFVGDWSKQTGHLARQQNHLGSPLPRRSHAAGDDITKRP
jgi:hypothetical protein